MSAPVAAERVDPDVIFPGTEYARLVSQLGLPVSEGWKLKKKEGPLTLYTKKEKKSGKFWTRTETSSEGLGFAPADNFEVFHRVKMREEIDDTGRIMNTRMVQRGEEGENYDIIYFEIKMPWPCKCREMLQCRRWELLKPKSVEEEGESSSSASSSAPFHGYQVVVKSVEIPSMPVGKKHVRAQATMVRRIEPVKVAGEDIPRSTFTSLSHYDLCGKIPKWVVNLLVPKMSLGMVLKMEAALKLLAQKKAAEVEEAPEASAPEASAPEPSGE